MTVMKLTIRRALHVIVKPDALARLIVHALLERPGEFRAVSHWTGSCTAERSQRRHFVPGSHRTKALLTYNL